MAGAIRRIHTSWLLSGPHEDETLSVDARWTYTFLNFCEQTELCGFFKFSIARLTSDQGFHSIQRTIEALMELDTKGAIVYDRPYVWLPSFYDDQYLPNFVQSHPAHVRNQDQLYRNLKENAENRAYCAFTKRFEGWLAGKGVVKAEEAEPKPPAKPRPGQQTVTAPELSEVRKIYDTFTIDGRKHPHADTASVRVFEWFGRNGWTDDWARRIERFILKDHEEHPFPTPEEEDTYAIRRADGSIRKPNW